MTTKSDNRSADPRRRRIVTGAALIAGAAAGFAGGATIASATAPRIPPQINGLRRFEGQVVLVTGATSGIGRATAMAFAKEGARVAFCGRREALGREVEARIRADGGEAMFVAADVRDEDDVEAFVNRTIQTYGKLDVAFNNAGVSFSSRLHESSIEEWDNLQATNLRGIFLAMRAELRHMVTAGKGQIIITASANIAGGRPDLAAYTASKRALTGLVQVAALEYANEGIRVNAICPGVTNTEMVRRQAGFMEMPDVAWNAALGTWSRSAVHGLKRPAQPEEIAAAVLSIASPEMAYMTGSMVFVDGGMTTAL
jgi:NAD(P)-dependent dehydrogenase (short-subunit alcohol dehydrogenase family)